MKEYNLDSMKLLQYCAREIGFRPAWKYEADAMERLKASRLVEQRADGGLAGQCRGETSA